MSYIQILNTIPNGDYISFLKACEESQLPQWSLHGFVRLEHAVKDAELKHPLLDSGDALLVSIFNEPLVKTDSTYTPQSCGGCGGGAVR